MAKTYRTMRGKQFNMDTLRIKGEKEIALGNMNVNAGGDQLGPGGVIIKDRNQRIREENALHTMVPGNAPVVKNKEELSKKTSANEAEILAAKEAEQILADSERNKNVDTPKGGLAASMVESTPTPKKKRTTKKKT